MLLLPICFVHHKPIKPGYGEKVLPSGPTPSANPVCQEAEKPYLMTAAPYWQTAIRFTEANRIV
jgi:hypothetical protein